MPRRTRWDEVEFLSRRAEQYEETLRLMYQRVTETRPDEEALRSDIEKLINALRRIMERLESLYCDNNEESEYEDSVAGLNAGISSRTQSGLVGRPDFEISVPQIQVLRDGVCFRWTDIARILCVSSRTLHRRHQELGMSVGHDSNFRQNSDASLNDVVKEILTTSAQSGGGSSIGNLTKVTTYWLLPAENAPKIGREKWVEKKKTCSAPKLPGLQPDAQKFKYRSI